MQALWAPASPARTRACVPATSGLWHRTCAGAVPSLPALSPRFAWLRQVSARSHFIREPFSDLNLNYNFFGLKLLPHFILLDLVSCAANETSYVSLTCSGACQLYRFFLLLGNC